ncbi:MAG: hypothetical protein DIU80_017655, partial [Chloroflexota bacterium]
AWGFFRNAKPQRPEDLIEYDFDKAAVMNIPGDWNTQNEQLFFYEGTVWFKRSFEWHSKADGHRTILYFGAVNYEARVWVNGRNAGYHVGGFTPFNMDITDLLTDGDNFVIVKVDNKRKAENVPTQIFDWWNYGGDPGSYARKLEVLRGHCEAVGRPFEAIVKSAQIELPPPTDAASAERTVARLRAYADLGVTHFMLDFGVVKDPEVVRRIGEDVLARLR